MAGDQRLPLVGRSAQLEQAREILAAGRSALALVRGEVGSGKTLFLQVWRRMAEERGSAVAGPQTIDGLSAAALSQTELLHTLVSLLRNRAPDLLKAAHESPVAHGKEGAGAVTRTTPLSIDPDGVAASLQYPSLVLLDGFPPSDHYVEWFNGVCLPALLKRASVPVVVAIADRSQRLRPFERLADHCIDFGSPEPAEIREFLLEQVTGVSLEEMEVERYVQGLLERPVLLEPLARVLEFAGGRP
jgi:hypothetical protein